MNRAQYLLGCICACALFVLLLMIGFRVDPNGPANFVLQLLAVCCVAVAIGCAIEALKQGVDSYEQEFGDDR